MTLGLLEMQIHFSCKRNNYKHHHTAGRKVCLIIVCGMTHLIQPISSHVVLPSLSSINWVTRTKTVIGHTKTPSNIFSANDRSSANNHWLRSMISYLSPVLANANSIYWNCEVMDFVVTQVTGFKIAVGPTCPLWITLPLSNIKYAGVFMFSSNPLKL